MGVVFQDPQNSLDPSFTIESQMVETMRTHLGLTKSTPAPERSRCSTVSASRTPRRRIRDHPHQLSGGMAQRAMIALAISCEPSLLIADEPTTALDVTVQAQILSLLRSLQDENGMSLLLISHDLGVIAEMADHMVVMYAGEVVERGTSSNIDPTAAPVHRGTAAGTTVAEPQGRPVGCHSRHGSQRRRHAIGLPVQPPLPPRHRPLSHSSTPCSTKSCPSRRRDACGLRNSSWQGVGTPLLDEGPRRKPESSERARDDLADRELTKKFPLRSTKLFGRKSQLTAVDDVSFDASLRRNHRPRRRERRRQVHRRTAHPGVSYARHRVRSNFGANRLRTVSAGGATSAGMCKSSFRIRTPRSTP